MFIKLEDIKDEITIDVRTEIEFQEMPLFQYNIEIINVKEHKQIKKFYPTATFIIFNSLFKKRKLIKKELLLLSENKTKKLVFGCSRGRLRSPAMYIYGRLLGIDCKILKNGIKVLFEEEYREGNLIKKMYNYLTFK